MKYSQQAYEIDEGYAENMAKSKINSLISSKNESVKELEAL